MRKSFAILSILALGLALGPKAQAESMRHHRTGQSGSSSVQSSSPGQSGQSESRSDRNFFRQASEGGQFEVQLGQLGQERATNAQVKELAQHLINEHQQANDQLKSLAQKNNVQLSTQIPNERQRRIEHLRSLSGDQFDKAFVQEVITEHRKDINLFQREAQQGTNTETKQFAQTILPKLQQHLQMAEQCQTQIQQGQGQQGSSTQRSGSKWGQQGTSQQQGTQGSYRQPQSGSQGSSAQPSTSQQNNSKSQSGSQQGTSRY